MVYLQIYNKKRWAPHNSVGGTHLALGQLVMSDLVYTPCGMLNVLAGFSGATGAATG